MQQLRTVAEPWMAMASPKIMPSRRDWKEWLLNFGIMLRNTNCLIMAQNASSCEMPTDSGRGPVNVDGFDPIWLPGFIVGRSVPSKESEGLPRNAATLPQFLRTGCYMPLPVELKGIQQCRVILDD